MFHESCRGLDSNEGPLVSEATAVSTVPQPLPHKYFFIGQRLMMICKNGIKLSQDDFPVYTLIKLDLVDFLL